MWRRHPITDLVIRRYLPDFRGALERSALNSWLGGTLSLNAEQEARGHLIAAHLIENLDLATVRVFYGLSAEATPDVKQGRR